MCVIDWGLDSGVSVVLYGEDEKSIQCNHQCNEKKTNMIYYNEFLLKGI